MSRNHRARVCSLPRPGASSPPTSPDPTVRAPRSTSPSRSRPPTFDQIADRLAARQHGVLTRQQLAGAGVSKGTIDRRLESGQLKPIHRGVYLVGPVLPPFALEMAACLACGPWLSSAIGLPPPSGASFQPAADERWTSSSSPGEGRDAWASRPIVLREWSRTRRRSSKVCPSRRPAARSTTSLAYSGQRRSSGPSRKPSPADGSPPTSSRQSADDTLDGPAGVVSSRRSGRTARG